MDNNKIKQEQPTPTAEEVNNHEMFPNGNCQTEEKNQQKEENE